MKTGVATTGKLWCLLRSDRLFLRQVVRAVVQVEPLVKLEYQLISSVLILQFDLQLHQFKVKQEIILSSTIRANLVQVPRLPAVVELARHSDLVDGSDVAGCNLKRIKSI